MPDAKRSTRFVHEFMCVAALALVLVALLAIRTQILTPNHPVFSQPADHHKYIHMAENDPFDFHIAPFCRRVGLPLLVKVIPLSTQASFRLISVIATLGTGIAVYYLAKSFGFSQKLSILGMLIFFSMGWATKFPMFDYWLPDALSLFLTTLALIYCRTKRDVPLSILLTVGVVVKESVIFIAPLYLTLQTLNDRREILRWSAVVAPALIVLAAMRLAFPSYNDDQAYLEALPRELRQVDREDEDHGFRERFYTISQQRFEDRSWSALHAYTVGTFGVLSLVLPFFDFRKNTELLLRFLPFVVLTYVQLLLATDTQRLLILAFPVTITMSLNGLEHLMRRFGIRTFVFVALSLALISLNLWHTARITGPVRFQACILTAGLVLAFLTRVKMKPE